MPAILVRQQRRALIDRPGDAERRVIPQKPAIMLGRIVTIHLVNHLGIGFEGTVAVGKPLGYENLIPLASAQLDSDMPTEAGRAPAYVDCHVKNRARRDA